MPAAKVKWVHSSDCLVASKLFDDLNLTILHLDSNPPQTSKNSPIHFSPFINNATMSNHVETPDQIVQVIRMVKQAQALEQTIIDILEKAISDGGPESTLVQKIKPIEDELSKLRLEKSEIRFPQGTMAAAYGQTLIFELESLSKSWLSTCERFGVLRGRSCKPQMTESC